MSETTVISAISGTNGVMVLITLAVVATVWALPTSQKLSAQEPLNIPPIRGHETAKRPLSESCAHIARRVWSYPDYESSSRAPMPCWPVMPFAYSWSAAATRAFMTCRYTT